MVRICCKTSSRSRVDKTAWLASYRMAIFCMDFAVGEILSGMRRITEVPKVTFKIRKSHFGRVGATPPSGNGLDHSENHQAEPEINYHPQIHFHGCMPCGWRQVLLEREVQRIPA